MTVQKLTYGDIWFCGSDTLNSADVVSQQAKEEINLRFAQLKTLYLYHSILS